ncbi:C-type lectin domain family 10 member A-like isoform X1 [Stegostoma tigrinum]|uniref:C-type lectin domain family 10 member A-like isoform X1 n=1 Tax=Stegostoma tigrinum TaxID=3053191 RepID=UPI00202B8CCD|nr:C-type lectin domain family 10 member A-like isoform X1 [Stegostoma tigrinum]XP_048378058.1 C-type lectin domain family 10 member A-like isoform X1 [Stegostoma tigrinum]
MVKDAGDHQEEIKMKVKNSADDAQPEGIQDASAGGFAKGTAGTPLGNFSKIIAYILLGLFVLLIIIFVVGLLKFKQISNEIKDLRNDVTARLADMKQELTNDIRNGHIQLQQGQIDILSAISSVSADVKHSQSKIKNDMANLDQQIRQAHNDIIDQLKTIKENCQPQLECPDQWKEFHQKCYYFSPNTEDWSTSQRFCLSKTSNLVVINSAEEQGFLNKEIRLTRHWIGLNGTNVDNWNWVDGTQYNTTFKFWAPGEPKDLRSYEACGGMKNDGRWNVYSCSQKLNFICERPVFCHFK